jgi:hypothetical protein
MQPPEVVRETLDLHRIHATWSRPHTIYVSGSAGVARMDELIGPGPERGEARRARPGG